MTIYILKVIGCSGVLLLAYWLFLEREKMLRFNRFYLLLAIIFSFGIPLVTVQTIPTDVVDEIMVSMNSIVSGQNGLRVTSPKPQNIWPTTLLVIYLVISAVMCFRFGRNLLALLKSIKHNENVNLETAKMILLNQVTTPYSFFDYIFVSKEDFSLGKIAQQILRHELAHVKQKHSLDILFIEIILIFGWINPILFLYRKAIQLNHEFLADESVVGSCGINEYQLLLVSKSSRQESTNLSSSFNYSFTKKRLIMMTKKTSIGTAIAKKISIASLAVICAFVFGQRAIAQQAKKEHQQALKQSEQAQKHSDQAQKHSEQAQKQSQQAEKDSQRAEKEAQKAEKTSRLAIHDDNTFVSVSSTANKAATNSNAQTWTLKQDSGTVQFKSSRPLNDMEKKKIENEFVKSTSTPLPKFPPTQAQLDSFLDEAVYRVWINGKRVHNWELKLYSPQDFGEVFVSALMKNAKDYGKYLFHVELKKKDGC